MDQQTNSKATQQDAHKKERLLGLAAFVTVVGGLAILNILQQVGFDFGILFWPCGFRVRTGLPCITCGMTRSVLAFSRAHLIEAFRFQPAAGFFMVVLLVLGGLGLFVAVSGKVPTVVRRYRAEFRLKRVLFQIALVLLAGWAVTLAQAWAHL